LTASLRQRLGLPPWHPAIVLGTWFWSGLLPVTPGTWGSLAALPFAWVIQGRWGAAGLVVGAVLVFAVGFWAAGVIVEASGVKDPGAIVVDEVAAQWLVLAVAPQSIGLYAIGFFLFRVADILKPWPASWADRRLPGALGVMVDDIISAFYAALLVALLGVLL
jgi:phosphatidylglycerophosphatase A